MVGPRIIEVARVISQMEGELGRPPYRSEILKRIMEESGGERSCSMRTISLAKEFLIQQRGRGLSELSVNEIGRIVYEVVRSRLLPADQTAIEVAEKAIHLEKEVEELRKEIELLKQEKETLSRELRSQNKS